MQVLLFCRMISVQEVVLSTAVSSLGTLGRGAWTRRVGWNRGKIFSFFVRNWSKVFIFCSIPGQDLIFFCTKPYDLELLIQEGFYIYKHCYHFWRSVANLGSCDQRTLGR